MKSLVETINHKNIKCIVFAATTPESLIFASKHYEIYEIIKNVPVMIKGCV